MNKSEEYWKILQSINDWIKYSDTKATILLTLYSVIITIVYSNAEAVYNSLNSSNSILFSGVVSVVLAIVSIVFSFLCINPSLKNKNPNSIIYFGHIKAKFETHELYKTEAEEKMNDPEKYTEEISEQIHTNSKIAWQKFSNITWSIRFFFLFTLSLALSLILYLVK